MKTEQKRYGKFYSTGVLLVLLHSFIIPQCNHGKSGATIFPYNVSHPDQTFVLDRKLAEVSGLSFVSDSVVALIQDEIGSIFFYNLLTKAVTKKISFSKKGDYEDLELLGDSAYVLRSDGSLFEVSNLFSGDYGIREKEFKTQLTGKNNTEGLCYNGQNKSLLIACKGDPEIKSSGDKYKGKKAIYSFDLSNSLMSDTPFVLIDVNAVQKISKSKYSNVIEKFMRFYRRMGAAHLFEPSGISIQPVTRDLYVISSVGKVLVVIEPSGKIAAAINLPAAIFRQPEGIAFDSQGNLYITNEGRNGRGNILKFNLQKDSPGSNDIL